jgi:hypothetical protein
MKLIKSTTLLIAVLFLAFACKKKCKIENVTVDSGAIKENVVLYPASGGMTGNMDGNYVIDANSPYADRFQMSLNNGERTAVNYANYTILAFPAKAKCNASYDRNVTVDNVAMTVTYKMIITQCDNCKEEYATENYVLVPAFPSNYAVLYELSVIDK